MGYVIRKPNITQVTIHGETNSYQDQRQYYRYYLVITTVTRRGVRMQDSVCCDYFRTPVKIRGMITATLLEQSTIFIINFQPFALLNPAKQISCHHLLKQPLPKQSQ